MGPATTDQTDYPRAKLYTFEGMDRITSPMMLEGDPSQIWFYPFIKTPLIMAMNVIDDESGAMNKRGGSISYLDNPDNQPIQNLIQFTNSATGISQQLRVSGNHIYKYAYSGNSWGSSVKTLSASNVRMRHASLNGYLHLSNGVDPLMYYDGTNFYNVVNASVSTNLTANVASTDTVINVTSTAGYNPSAGFIKINNNSEIIAYNGTTNNSFTNCVRGFNGTTAATYSSGNSVANYFGSPPTSPKIIYNIKGRLWAFNLNVPGGGSAFQVASARGSITDSTNWIITANSESQNGSATGTLDPGSSQVYFLSADDGQQITGVGYTNGVVIVAKGESLFEIQVDAYGNPGPWIQLSGQYGALSHEGLVNLDSNIFLFNEYGILSTDSTKPVIQSYQINDLARGVPQNNLSAIYGVKHNYTLMYSVGNITEATRFGGLTYNNAVLVYNYATTNWFLWTYPFTINAYSELFDMNGTLQLYYGDTNGQCYVYSPTDTATYATYSDNGVDIPVRIETRYYFFREPTKTDDFRNTTVIAENGAAGSLYYSLIREPGPTRWAELMKLPNFVNTREFPQRDRQGKGIAYKILESSSGDFRFRAIEQEYEQVAF